MDFATLTTKAAEAVAGGDVFGKIVKFDFGDVGKLLINGPAGTATNEDGDADATISLKWEDFLAMQNGDLQPMAAFMQQKIKIAGDMQVAMQLQGLMEKFNA